MNKKKIIATFLLSANLFGSAFFSNTSAFQISTSGYNNENVKVQTENDHELTFFTLAKRLNQKYHSLPPGNRNFFRIETLDLSQVSNIDKDFFSSFNKFLSNSSQRRCVENFTNIHHEYHNTRHGLVALNNKDIKIILSDDMTSKIINNPSKYGISKTTIIYQNISAKNIHIQHAKSEKNSHIDWKKYNLENKLIKKYNARPDTQTNIQFAQKFIEDYKNDLLDASTIKNYPNIAAIIAKIYTLLDKRNYENGTVNYNKEMEEMEIQAEEKMPKNPSQKIYPKKKRLCRQKR